MKTEKRILLPQNEYVLRHIHPTEATQNKHPQQCFSNLLLQYLCHLICAFQFKIEFDFRKVEWKLLGRLKLFQNYIEKEEYYKKSFLSFSKLF